MTKRMIWEVKDADGTVSRSGFVEQDEDGHAMFAWSVTVTPDQTLVFRPMSDRLSKMLDETVAKIREASAHYLMNGECVYNPCYYCKPWLKN